MNFVRKPILNFIIAIVYITILQSSVINTLYTLYVTEGLKAKAVVKEQNTDSKGKPKWAIRAHVVSVNVKYCTELHLTSSYYYLYKVNEFTTIDFLSITSFYKSINPDKTTSRAPPFS